MGSYFQEAPARHADSLLRVTLFVLSQPSSNSNFWGIAENIMHHSLAMFGQYMNVSAHGECNQII